MKGVKMICPNCKNELKKTVFESYTISYCKKCKGMWIDSFTFENIKNYESPFGQIININLWKEAENKTVEKSEKKCPQCLKNMAKIKYGDSNVFLEICKDCKGIWFDRGELEKVIKYIEETIDNETIKKLFEELGEEIKNFLIGEETINEEINHIGAILKLMEYRILAKFPSLEKLITSMPI